MDEARCRGKQKLDRVVAMNLVRRASRRQDHPLNAFKCQDCGGWHVGSRVAPRKYSQDRSRRPSVEAIE